MPVHPTAVFADSGDGAGVRAAESALQAAGFSIGPMQARESRCLLLGDVKIAKWRNLTAAERIACHGQMWGGRGGSVTIMLHADAPSAAVAAFYKVLAAADGRRGIAA
ncbi:MAG: hypothetical protein KAY22_12540 [Rhizorhabdus sp.]|uniref:hypothetical protein n=1 Tax=Rhizorhabdus sp. TaxID=1968843 RepID=UPI001B5589C6|nr:hypothetical protein [Rhizorhabdus sp.]MBP8233127.1 hypothetical protein [Rhizorhabdus sp.]